MQSGALNGLGQYLMRLQWGHHAWFEIVLRFRYEPWTLVDRKVAPWHDTRFRGYGQNKIVHIAHMNASGFKFEVLNNAFLVHRLVNLPCCSRESCMETR